VAAADPLSQEQRQQREDAITPALQRFGYRLLHIYGDGSCGFRCLSLALHKSEQQHGEVRKQVVKWMGPNMARSEYAASVKDWPKYLVSLARPSTYMDEFVIYAASKLFNIEIAVYDFKTLRGTTAATSTECKPVIYPTPDPLALKQPRLHINLLHVDVPNLEHFDLLVPEKDYEQWFEWSDKGGFKINACARSVGASPRKKHARTRKRAARR
jgi:hypothetical protein